MVDPLVLLPMKLRLGTGSAPTTTLSFGPVRIPNQPALKHLDVLAGVTSRGRDEANAAVLVLVVVPADEPGDPTPGLLEGGEGSPRELWTVLHRPEQSFGVGVVVGDSWPAEGRNDAEHLERRQQCRTLHRTAIIRV